MAGQNLVLALSLVLMASAVNCAPAACKRITAAFYFNYNMYFVIGDELLEVGEDNTIVNRSPVSDLAFPYTITAAYGLYDAFYLLSAKHSEGYDGVGQLTGTTDVAYSAVTEKLGAAADAAVEDPWGSITYIAGCHNVYVEQGSDEVSDVDSNTVLGLPCYLDAALYLPTAGQPAAIKGNKLWVYDESTEEFVGPQDMGSYLWALEDENLCEEE